MWPTRPLLETLAHPPPSIPLHGAFQLQSETPKAQATACASSRSCLVTYPIKEQYGLLWLWPDASPTAPLESAAAAPAVSVALGKHYEAGGDVNWYMRDLPYGG
jgi:pheophorbide a oxygenase